MKRKNYNGLPLSIAPVSEINSFKLHAILGRDETSCHPTSSLLRWVSSLCPASLHWFHQIHFHSVTTAVQTTFNLFHKGLRAQG